MLGSQEVSAPEVALKAAARLRVVDAMVVKLPITYKILSAIDIAGIEVALGSGLKGVRVSVMRLMPASLDRGEPLIKVKAPAT